MATKDDVPYLALFGLMAIAMAALVALCLTLLPKNVERQRQQQMIQNRNSGYSKPQYTDPANYGIY